MVWHFCNKCDSDKLDLLNKRILRFIFKDWNSDFSTLLIRAGITNLANGRTQNMILSVFKCCIFL